MINELDGSNATDVRQGGEDVDRVVDGLKAEINRLAESQGFHEVNGARKLIANSFIKGVGMEVGAGNRPFPVPSNAVVFYSEAAAEDGPPGLKPGIRETCAAIDAEDFRGIVENSLDFLISAHVIQHIRNPLGSIIEGLKRLRRGGTYILVVPDKRSTSDLNRPDTSFEHLLSDNSTGGEDTLFDAYVEHCRYVHPINQAAFSTEDELLSAADFGFQNKIPIHVHSWTRETFFEHLISLSLHQETLHGMSFFVAFSSQIANEAIFVLKKL